MIVNNNYMENKAAGKPDGALPCPFALAPKPPTVSFRTDAAARETDITF
ncbi:MAG: hypothetical protein ACREUR_06650 [Nitrosospira sp.]